MPEVYGVFEGGGVRGTALVGAVAAAEKHGITFRAVAGTSAGAIVASLLAAGYTAAEMLTLLMGMDFQKFKDPVGFPGCRKAASWWKLGLHRGDEFYHWIGQQLSLKLTGDVHKAPTFKELPRPLTVVAADVVQQQEKVFSKESTRDTQVAFAVRASMSIPFFFVPLANGPELLVDGGVLSNFPAWVFQDEQKKVPLPILGFRLQDQDEPPARIGNLKDLALALAATVVRGSVRLQLAAGKLPGLNIIELPTLGVGTTDFDLSGKMKNELYKAGYRESDNWLLNNKLTAPPAAPAPPPGPAKKG
jgi:NTE family protein